MREPENAPLALGIDLGSVGIKAVLYRGGIVDAIVAPTHGVPNDGLVAALRKTAARSNRPIDIRVVGDCASPRSAVEAVFEGHEAGRAL